MTEAEWLACSDPQPMLQILRSRAGRRKVRLFACACGRSVWKHFGDIRCRRALEVSERFADGEARRAELLAAREAAEEAVREAAQQMEANLHRPGAGCPLALILSYRVAAAARGVTETQSAVRAAGKVARAVQELRAALAEDAVRSPAAYFPAMRAEAQAQAAVLRDLFGNPFRPVPLDPACLTSDVAKLAQGIYDQRAFDRMPELAEALEEAGCTHTDLLAHCRGPGPHARGCFAVDAVLGKE